MDDDIFLVLCVMMIIVRMSGADARTVTVFIFDSQLIFLHYVERYGPWASAPTRICLIVRILHEARVDHQGSLRQRIPFVAAVAGGRKLTVGL